MLPPLLPDGRTLGTPLAQARLLPSSPRPSTHDDAAARPGAPGDAEAATADPTGEGTAEDLAPYAGTFYAQVGGSETFRRLTELFYAGVAEDAEFRSMYPEEDLRPAAVRLQLFLEQYWGGPTTYSQRRGHPRLRMRHVPYVVNSANRDTWLRHMRNALDQLDLPPLQDATLWDYFDRAAHSLQNAPD
jgi:hemoglobin